MFAIFYLRFDFAFLKRAAFPENRYIPMPETVSEKVKIIFIAKGERREFQVPIGTTVLEAAHQNNIDLEGACEGSLACSTCHVIVKDRNFYDMLPAANEDEEDMLDLAFGLSPTSRLGCQIVLTKELSGLTLIVPDETRNVSINN